jgi:hypothetical protein
MLDACDLATRKDPMLPLGLVGVLDPLNIHVVVDFFDQLEADNAIIRRLVCFERALALISGEVVEFLGSLGVENLVDTETRLGSVTK